MEKTDLSETLLNEGEEEMNQQHSDEKANIHYCYILIMIVLSFSFGLKVRNVKQDAEIKIEANWIVSQEMFNNYADSVVSFCEQEYNVTKRVLSLVDTTLNYEPKN